MEATKQEQYVEVGIASERYSIKIDEIHEIIKMQEITVLPQCEPHVKGIINLRGKIIPVISLRVQLDMSEVSDSKTTRIVVVNHSDQLAGIIVDKVTQVTSFESIQAPPDHVGSEKENAYVSGIGRNDTGLVCILNVGQVLKK